MDLSLLGFLRLDFISLSGRRKKKKEEERRLHLVVIEPARTAAGKNLPLFFIYSMKDFWRKEAQVILEYLVNDLQMNVVNERNENGETLLFKAWEAGSGKQFMMEYLIKLGADINAKNINNETALYHVSCFEEAKSLVQLGISLDEVDNNGLTAVHKLILDNKLDIVKIL